MRSSPRGTSMPPLAALLFALWLLNPGLVYSKHINSFAVHLNMAVWSNNQWKENAFIFNFPRACTTLRDHLPDFYDMVALGVPARNGSCHLEASGTHVVENVPMSWNFPKFKVMPYGRYRFNLKFGNGTTTSFCTLVDGTVIPKPR